MYVYAGTNDNQLIATKVLLLSDGSSHERIHVVEPLIDPAIITTTTTTTTTIGNNNHAAAVATSAAVTCIVKHPQFPILYAFSSFGSFHSSMVTTFRITAPDGILERMGNPVKTGGLNASHAVISPLNKDTLCVSHANDGSMAFFDISNPTALEAPLQIVQTPEVRPETRSTEPPHCLPSLSHACYHVIDDGNDDADHQNTMTMVLLTSDTSAQGRVWTHAVDSQGIPVPALSGKSSILHQHKCHVSGAPTASFRLSQAMIMPPIPKSRNTIRRTVLHPTTTINGNFAYVLLDSHAVIHVYEVFQSSSKQRQRQRRSSPFQIGGDCLQEVPLPIATTSSGGVHAGATEMIVTDTAVWVAVKSKRLHWGGTKRETRIQKYSLREGGARLEMDTGGTIVVAGWVDQFQVLQQGDDDDNEATTIMAGVSNRKGCPASIETFRTNKNKGGCVKIGHVDLEGATNVSCFVTVQDDFA